MPSHLQVLQVSAGVTHHRHYFTLKKQRKKLIILPLLPSLFLHLRSEDVVVPLPRQKSVTRKKMPCNGRHLQHRDRSDSRIVLMACTQQQCVRLLDVGLLKMYADFYLAFFLSLSCAISTTIMLWLWSTAKQTHTRVAARNDKILFLIFCCVLYCIAHGNRWYYGSWKQSTQIEKKADEHGKRPTPKSQRTFAGRTIERTHSHLAANTHTHTLQMSREKMCFLF